MVRNRARHGNFALHPFPGKFPVGHMQPPMRFAPHLSLARRSTQGEMFRQFFNEMYGPVTAPSTPNRDGYVFFTLLHKARQDKFSKLREAGKIIREVGVTFNVGSDCRIGSCLGS